MEKRPYTRDGRLSDVLALIQVLALDEHTYRGPTGLEGELKDKPASSDSWIDLAREHKEFFRIGGEKKNVVSLVARHVTPHQPDQPRQPLTSEFTSTLLQTAITLHDRQVSAEEKWRKYLAPLWPALIGGVFGTVSTLVTIYFKGCLK